jgi:hypothetical protein
MERRFFFGILPLQRASGEVKLAIKKRSTKGIIDPNFLTGHHEED